MMHSVSHGGLEPPLVRAHAGHTQFGALKRHDPMKNRIALSIVILSLAAKSLVAQEDSKLPRKASALIEVAEKAEPIGGRS